MSSASIATALLERWSRKDAQAVGALLHKDAVLVGPLPLGSRLEGADNIRAFLQAQNTDRRGFPAEDLTLHEHMASSRAQVRRIFEQRGFVAIEAALATPGRRSNDVALFLDIDEASGLISRIAIYFNAPPRVEPSPKP